MTGLGLSDGTHWNYRICRHPDGSYGLHEVYYEAGASEGSSWTADPCDFVADAEEGPEAVVEALERALSDARGRPVFVIPEDE